MEKPSSGDLRCPKAEKPGIAAGPLFLPQGAGAFYFTESSYLLVGVEVASVLVAPFLAFLLFFTFAVLAGLVELSAGVEGAGVV